MLALRCSRAKPEKTQGKQTGRRSFVVPVATHLTLWCDDLDCPGVLPLPWPLASCWRAFPFLSVGSAPLPARGGREPGASAW